MRFTARRAAAITLAVGALLVSGGTATATPTQVEIPVASSPCEPDPGWWNSKWDDCWRDGLGKARRWGEQVGPATERWADDVFGQAGP